MMKKITTAFITISLMALFLGACGNVEYWGVENAGIFTANGRQNKSVKKRKELYRFGKSL